MTMGAREGTSGDAASVSVFVRTSPHEAFEVFTSEIDLWWRSGPKYRIAGKRRGQLFFEPELGGRLFETFEVSKWTTPCRVGPVTFANIWTSARQESGLRSAEACTSTGCEPSREISR